MCEFFSYIVTKAKKLLFCEGDSHEIIINRLRLNDNKLIDRDFVRIEITPVGSDYIYRIDEVDTLPMWYQENQRYFRRNGLKLFKKIHRLRLKYEKISDSAFEEYKKIERPAFEEYNKMGSSVYKKYKKIQRLAIERHNKLVEPAWQDYIKAIGEIEGYVGRDMNAQ